MHICRPLRRWSTGKSPYPALDDPILEDQKGYVYPPQIVLLLVPFTWLPVAAVALLATLLLVALLGLTLWILEIRDVRCYAAAFLWVPTISGLLLGNVSIPLAFALAVLWRYRDRVWPPGAALGLSVSAKLVLWPMFIWMLATRRLRASALAVVIGVAVTLGAWALIGFDGLTGYPDLVRRLSDIQAENSYSLVGMAATAGLPSAVGAGAHGSRGRRVARRLRRLRSSRRRPSLVHVRGRGDAGAVTDRVAPLPRGPLVPLAIARPRFSLIWLLPILLWVSPKPGYAEGFQAFLPAVAVVILLCVILARPQARARIEPAVA